MRIDDETAGIPLVSSAAGAFAGELLVAARLLHLQAGLHPGRRVLPLALPLVRGDEPRQARRQRTDLTGKRRAAHRRAREDRHVHRAAPAARRRPHHDHHPLPARTRCGGSPRCRTAPTGSTGSRSSASTCATPRRSSRSPTTSRRPGPLDILINNACPDRAPLAGRLRAAGRGRARAAARAGRAARAGHLRPDHRGAPAAIAGALAAPPSPTTGDREPRRAQRRDADRAGADGRLRLARRAPRRHRRSTPAACCPTCRRNNSLDPERRARSTRWSCSRCSCATRPRRSCWSPGCAPALAAARRRGRTLRRQRLGDGGAVQPRLQGRRAPAHQHGQGRAEHADAHERGRDARDRRHPHDRASTPAGSPTSGRTRRRCGSPTRASTPRSTSSTAPPASTTRSSAARPARTSSAAS